MLKFLKFQQIEYDFNYMYSILLTKILKEIEYDFKYMYIVGKDS